MKVGGSVSSIQQIAQVSVANPQMLVVSVYDVSHAKPVASAIATSDLGFNPQIEGPSIRVPIPKMSNEIRQKLVKQISKIAEQGNLFYFYFFSFIFIFNFLFLFYLFCYLFFYFVFVIIIFFFQPKFQ